MAITSSDKPGAGGLDPQQQAYIDAFAAAIPGGAAGGGKVYMGPTYGQYGPHGGSGTTAPQRKAMDLIVPEDEALKEYYTWNAKKQSDFVGQLILAGKLKLGDGMAEGATEWEKLVKLSAKYTAAGNKVSPYDILATYVKASGGGNAWTNAGVWQINTQTNQRRYVGPGTYLGDGKAQQTDTRVDLTDPDTARSISTQLFQNLMGRDPGEGELAAFANALHTAEQNNPVVSTTTTQYDMETGQQLGTDTTQSGGLTADAKAYIEEQKIKKTKEYGALQAATTYENAFENLVYGAPE